MELLILEVGYRWEKKARKGAVIDGLLAEDRINGEEESKGSWWWDFMQRRMKAYGE